ncbi:hypothetical protein C8R45DRAFT_1069729 [Mycena sanguinolenta]|nr:hypothetical protein C8R45DRAFT_1069729 [Mycena sanguinolenta]
MYTKITQNPTYEPHVVVWIQFGLNRDINGLCDEVARFHVCGCFGEEPEKEFTEACLRYKAQVAVRSTDIILRITILAKVASMLAMRTLIVECVKDMIQYRPLKPTDTMKPTDTVQLSASSQHQKGEFRTPSRCARTRDETAGRSAVRKKARQSACSTERPSVCVSVARRETQAGRSGSGMDTEVGATFNGRGTINGLGLVQSSNSSKARGDDEDDDDNPDRLCAETAWPGMQSCWVGRAGSYQPQIGYVPDSATGALPFIARHIALMVANSTSVTWNSSSRMKAASPKVVVQPPRDSERLHYAVGDVEVVGDLGEASECPIVHGFHEAGKGVIGVGRDFECMTVTALAAVSARRESLVAAS